MMDDLHPKQVFSLRGHRSAISYLETICLNGKRYSISSDSSGLIIIWDINIKRPFKQWQAHTDTVLTIKQIEQEFILTQSRDSTVKVWKVPSGPELPNEVFMLPINSLNFCNVEYNNHNLFTPASVDSNNFDVYNLKFDLDCQFDFTRTITNYSSYQQFKKHNKIEEIQRDGELARDDFGIVMKFLFIEESNRLFLGFESGQVIGLEISLNQSQDTKIEVDKTTTSESGSRLSDIFGTTSKSFNKTIINKDPSIRLIYANSYHSPNPVLSMAHSNNKLITGSTNKKLVIHDYLSFTFESEDDDSITVKKLNYSGIQSLTVNNKYEDLILVSYWSGLIEGILLGGTEEESISTKFQIKRELPRVNTLETSVANSEVETQLKGTIKLNCLSVMEPYDNKSQQRNSYRELVRSRNNYNGQLIFSGFEDGTIVVYRL